MRGPSIRETPFSTPRLTAERQISELECHVRADNAASRRLFISLPRSVSLSRNDTRTMQLIRGCFYCFLGLRFL